jgi:excisionase family DNA binding protein
MFDDMKIDPKRHYATSTAAKLLAVSASTVRDLERRGRLTGTRTPGGQRRFAGTELLRLQEESTAVPPRKARVTSAHVAGTAEDTKARQTWLGALIAGAQRELPTDTSGEIRLRLSADIERALRPFGPAAAVGDLQPLVKSLVEQATQQQQATQEDAERREMKRELIDFGLAQLRRGIDVLAPRLVGRKRSLTRRHIQATLRDEFRAMLHRELRGDEDWGQVRGRAEEFAAAWYVRQAPTSRIPKAATLIAVGATGVIGGRRRPPR